MVESVHSAKINSRGRCDNNPPSSVFCPKKVQIKSWIQSHLREQTRGKGSKICRGPRTSREASADAQPQQGSLNAAALPSWGSPGSGPLSWLHGQGGPPASLLLQPSASKAAVAPSSQSLFSTAAPCPSAPGLSPGTAEVKQRQNPGPLAETQKDL